jgi:hypothetical protein
LIVNPTLRNTYWQLTALLLAAHFAGWTPALAAAIALTAVHALHEVAWHRSLRPLSAQVPVLYVAMLAAGALVPPLGWLHLVQFAGLCVRLCSDYCLAARLLVLMPWNRAAPLSLALLRRVLLAPPVNGSVLWLVQNPARSDA